ncbi:acVLRF1 family peptidyl-tRNA hydrolase [Aestuariimicrobium sp. T2.26MG-19.2B]|uniref:acVLRF1 family peptidyl-tRNA hydrolase n=1 Tax=Aestuariimicrobium sp. T2.26MG-19.2B TaxID=3040679 RepID=UPI002477C4AF|nr:acVLRF1 family peptidyl-tRNA hydrolase [Aestuariimicrobium sp. T2.26MG-19.2B]CAI9400939.1 hypothetical protein AESSP_00493 [Aestuariimicrobium sp. T2.26MG-19.2B]
MEQRRVIVPAERVRRWFENFGARHGGFSLVWDEGHVIAHAADGAEAMVSSGWGALPELVEVEDLSAWFLTERTIGVVVARKGAHAVAVFEGRELRASKVDTHYVQGRTKAGGWSQQRYARRRQNQADKAYHEAADEAARILLPVLESLEAVVCGGDHQAIATILQDPRLAPLRPLLSGHGVLPAPEPRRVTLIEVVDLARSATITLNELA